MTPPDPEVRDVLNPFSWMTDLVNSATAWLPDGIEPYVQVLIYMGILGAISLVPLVLWLLWAARPPRTT